MDDGYRFSCEPTRLWLSYLAHPLFCLPQVLSERCVPFVDNISTLRELRDSGLDMDLSLAFMSGAFAKNSLLHEGGHCVAASVLLPSTLQADPTETSYRHLLSEAFAFCLYHFCACEAQTADALLGCVGNDIAILSEDVQLFRGAAIELGSHAVMAAFMGAFLLYLCKVRRGSVTTSQLASLCGVPNSVAGIGTVDRLVGLAYKAVPGFAAETQNVYFELVQLPRPSAEDLLDRVESDRFRSLFRGAASVLGELVLGRLPA